MSDMIGHRLEEKESAVREYFTLGGRPLCADCGDDFEVQLHYGADGEVSLEMTCTGCANGFTWSPPRTAREWEPLHLDYFEERWRMGEELLCPYDDCVVLCTEYSDHRVLFRCPYCGRRGIRSDETVQLDSAGIEK